MDKKEIRREKKRTKLLVEFQLAKSNDEVKRPGEFLDSPFVKKLKVDPAEGEGKKRLSPEEFQELKKQLKERKKFLSMLPRFHLQYAGSVASLSTSKVNRTPVLVSDVQQLLLYAVGGNTVSYPPERWCALEKFNRLTHIVAVILEGISCQDFFTYEHLFPKLTSIFPDRVEVFSPTHYGNDVAQEMALVPMSLAQKQSILSKYGSLEAALSSKEVFKVFRALFPINFEETESLEETEMNGASMPVPAPLLPPQDMFPRTYLILSLQQMMLEGFPLPFEYDMANKYSDFIMTKKKYKEVSVSSPIFAVDCEMCKTGPETQELTRIAIINEEGKAIIETLVKPKHKILDYLTRYSGITKDMLQDVTTTLEDVQEMVQNLLPDDAILIGHSLNCDLRAMKMMHPYVIDTSVSFNLTGVRNKKAKLSALAEKFLDRLIQQGNDGHHPFEDATACMDLIKLKLLKGYQFGDALHAGADEETATQYQLTASIFNQTQKANKSVSIIASDSILETYKNFAVGINPTTYKAVRANKAEDAFKHLQEIVMNNDMVITHLDLEDKVEAAAQKSEKKLEKLMRKVDTWCDSVYSNVSKNGMCVVLFAGSKSNSLPLQGDSDRTPFPTQSDSDSIPAKKAKQSNPDSPSKDENGNSSTSSSSPISQTSTQQRSRRNGACFIRINSNLRS